MATAKGAAAREEGGASCPAARLMSAAVGKTSTWIQNVLAMTPVLRQRAAAKNWIAVAMLAPKARARPRQSRPPKAGPTTRATPRVATATTLSNDGVSLVP